MSARANWWATAVGTAVGTGGWILGIGRIFWPAHPYWALFWVTLAATLITQFTVEYEIRYRISRAQDAQNAAPPKTRS